MVELNGYTLDGNWEPSPNGQWVFATKDRNKYFIKTFRYPRYPNDTTSRIYAQRKKACDDWEKNQKLLISKLRSVAGPSGNVVVPVDLFREGVSFYKVTLRVNTSTLSPKEIAMLPEEKEKLLLLKTMVGSIGALHRVQIVHGDLKPENILISRSESGNLISKIIDFDDSYFEKKIPKAEMAIGTPNYYSPELGKYVNEESETLGEKITCKSDIFALGIIFHEYLTGNKPTNPKFPEEYTYCIVGNGSELMLDSSLSSGMIALLKRMLHIDPVERPDCGEVLVRLKEIEKNPVRLRHTSPAKKRVVVKPTLHRRPPINPTAVSGTDEIKRITRISNNFKIEYESGKFVTVPYIYIKANKLEDRVEK